MENICFRWDGKYLFFGLGCNTPRIRGFHYIVNIENLFKKIAAYGMRSSNLINAGQPQIANSLVVNWRRERGKSMPSARAMRAIRRFRLVFECHCCDRKSKKKHLMVLSLWLKKHSKPFTASQPPSGGSRAALPSLRGTLGLRAPILRVCGGHWETPGTLKNEM